MAIAHKPVTSFRSDVLGVPVVVVVRDVAVLVVLDLPGRVGERVPDRDALAVLVPRAFDLVGGSRDPPVEALGEPTPQGGCRLNGDRAQTSYLLPIGRPRRTGGSGRSRRRRSRRS